MLPEIIVFITTSLIIAFKIQVAVCKWREADFAAVRIIRMKSLYAAAILIFALQVISYKFIWEHIVVYQYIDFILSALLCGAVDWRHKIIPNELVITFGLSQLIYGLMTMQFSALGLNLLIGAGTMVVLILISILTKGKLGIGDGKVIGVMVAFAGWQYMLQVLFLGLIAAFLWCVVLLLRKKTTLKAELPFMPFIVVGIIMQAVLTVGLF